MLNCNSCVENHDSLLQRGREQHAQLIGDVSQLRVCVCVCRELLDLRISFPVLVQPERRVEERRGFVSIPESFPLRNTSHPPTVLIYDTVRAHSASSASSSSAGPSVQENSFTCRTPSVSSAKD